MSRFYDDLAPLYHLIHEDWPASVRTQGEQLASLIGTGWPGGRRLLDVSCGIGTQAIGLALQGYDVTASDLSAGAVVRAREEAHRWGVGLAVSACDMRRAHAHHGGGFDVVLSCDNSLPHLLSDDDILIALRQMFDCLVDGGGCVVSVRDYARETRGRHLVKPYGVRLEAGKRYLLFQVWDFDGDDFYDFTFFFVEEDLASGAVATHAMRSRYYALSVERVCALMREAGFENVHRAQTAFYQPVIAATKPGPRR
ncbi:class I SAM-dependent methyltransferase [Schlegelella sp. S2-27]|uniref:Class I SAM-dependent methyltransferase n=1 Tax=Caldimonas mangrovi TaxID=2944811 RepID=A0ABT0YVP1_9BURK|nr:class I SAM-dependent methyltransferase [Caldimonas mangrovi]MCM5682663.1 class I SAM-dependent methyltransferase [Caldimonas mangrovi]